MNNGQSALDTLIAFAIVFAAGVASSTLVTIYGKWMKRKGESEVPH